MHGMVKSFTEPQKDEDGTYLISTGARTCMVRTGSKFSGS